MSGLWYKNAVFYAVDVATFQDTNGDGVGDFPGLLSRLDYLADLGVNAVWLLPFYPSPVRDNGYDVTDYYRVHPRCGTLDDVIEVVHAAGERGIRIILDLVADHTSNEHPWFQAARRDRGSRFRRYYVWSDAPPPVPPERGPIFSGSESSVWTYDDLAAAYYYHRFYHFEPDLDPGNPEVRDEIKRVMDFWLSFGVSGFRLDAASHMIEPKGEEPRPDQPHTILKDLRSALSQRRPDAVFLGESDVPAEQLRAFFGEGDELQLLYNFLLANHLFLAFARRRAEPLARVLRLLPPLPEAGQWVNFLRNLDELDLERLTDAEREEVYRAFAPEPTMRIFGRGVRRRLASMLGDRRRVEGAFSLLFSLPGTPLLIYGDEIGMGEDLSLEGRNAVRTPMQWSAERHAGFTRAATPRLVRPVIEDGPFGYRRVNVVDQDKDPASLLNQVKRLIRIRHECPEWAWGDPEIVTTDEPAVFAHRVRWQRGELLAVHNLSDQVIRVTLDLGGPLRRPVPLLVGGTEAVGDPARPIELEGYGYRWYRLDTGRA
ncbi:alpha-amylase family protein [Candidatus Nitrospira bockiana]